MVVLCYERLDEVVECTPLGYALRFPGSETKTVALLRQRGAAEWLTSLAISRG